MPQPSEHRYLKFISYLQIIAIILVVFGHSFHQYPDGAVGYTLWFLRLIDTVHLPIFTFVSGYLMYYTSFVMCGRHHSWAHFTKGKIARLLVPYLTLSLVTFVPRAALSGYADDILELSITDLLHSLLYADHLVIPYFWFLLMCFILLVGCYGLFLMCTRCKLSHDIAIAALTTIFILLPLLDIRTTTLFAINKLVNYGIYFMLGVAYCRYTSTIDRYLHTSDIITAIVSGVLWVTLFFAFNDKIAALPTSIFGILLFLTLCHRMEEKDIRIFDHLQGANYIIFLLSWYVNVASQQLLAHFVHLPWWIHTLLSFIGGIYIPYLGIIYLQKHSGSRLARLTAYLFGQKLPPSSTERLDITRAAQQI